MDDSAGDCPVCWISYGDTSRRPCTLPCGHSFCNLCIDRVKEQSQLRCPTCCAEHALPEAGQFPINYALEAFMNSVSESGQNEQAGLSRVMCSRLQEQEDKVLAAIRTCQVVQAHLEQYQTTLADWGEQQQNLEDRLQALVDQSKDARVLIRQEETQVADKKEQLQQGEQQLHALLQLLRTVTTRQEAYKTIDEADHRIDEEIQRAEECREKCPDVHTVTTISKVREASSAALEAATTVQAAQETALVPAGAVEDCSIADKLEALVITTLKADDLRSLTQPARILLQAGLVFAIHLDQEEGRSRHGKISLEDGHLYLHSLRDIPPVPRAITVQVDEVVPAAPPCLVFLDLAWPGSTTRRVLVHLSSDTPLGRQFLLFCTGQRGPCYVKTRLWQVVNKGLPGEGVCGGDYENNNGTGGAALLPDLAQSEYLESGRAGAVWGWWCRDPGRGALFGITIRDWQQSFGAPCVFGEVVGGLEGVAAAAQHSPLSEVTVVDCGVVLWE